MLIRDFSDSSPCFYDLMWRVVKTVSVIKYEINDNFYMYIDYNLDCLPSILLLSQILINWHTNCCLLFYFKNSCSDTLFSLLVHHWFILRYDLYDWLIDWLVDWLINWLIDWLNSVLRLIIIWNIYIYCRYVEHDDFQTGTEPLYQQQTSAWEFNTSAVN